MVSGGVLLVLQAIAQEQLFRWVKDDQSRFSRVCRNFIFLLLEGEFFL